MPTTTTNYNLVKPIKATENADIDVINSNMDKIDAQLKTNADGVGSLKADYVRQPAYATTGGTLTAYTVTLTPAPASIAEGFGITIVPHVVNGASPTLNTNGLGAVALKDQKGVAYAAGKLLAGKPYMFRKVGSDFLADSSGGAGDATAGDIRAGKKASTDAGDIVGTLVVQAGGIVTPTASNIVKPAGIYDTAITVTGVTVPPAKVLNDTTIAGVTGAIPIRNPDVADQIAASNVSAGAYTSGDPNTYIYLGAPSGQYVSPSVAWIRYLANGLTNANVRSGVSLFNGNIVGTLVEGKRAASGTLTGSPSNPNTVSGLNFTPSIVVIRYVSSGLTVGIFYFLGTWFADAIDVNGNHGIYIGTLSSSTVFSGGFSAYLAFASGVSVSWSAIE